MTVFSTPRPPRRLDREEKAVALRLLKRGQSPELVAAAFGVSWWSIRSILERDLQKRGQGRNAMMSAA